MSAHIALTRAVVRRLGLVAIGGLCLILGATPFAMAGQTPPPAEVESQETPAKGESPEESPETPTPATEPNSPETPAKEESPPDSPETPAEKPTDESAPADRQGPTDPAELEAFLDGIMAVHMKDKHIAGATISVVVDNRPFFSKGYGYANVETRQEVDPDKTMFRIGSVSKLFTWTAVMQLAEQGKLDLDADVNTYLEDFKIPATYPQPITLKHLMTHTPGFEDHAMELFARSAEEVEPLGTLLARQLPARVRPPGELASYSNHGTAIAGYIVEQVSGMPWQDYIEQKILEPLGMKYTLVRQPPESELPAEMSKGYKFERGRYVAEGFEYVPLAPAGTIGSSAGDMAKFMIAHLQDGRYESTQILQEKTARQMRELLFTHDKTLDGMAYGFMRMTHNGEQLVHHPGDTILFHSLLVMLPERKTGFFVSYNTATATETRSQLLEAFVDRYFPAPDSLDKENQEKEPNTGETASLDRLVGSYGGLRHSHTSITKLGALLNTVNVSVDDGDLLLSGLGDNPKRFVEVQPLLFREVDDQDTLAFRQDEQGRITHLFLNDVPYMAYRKLAWNETPRFMLLLVGGCALVFLSAVIGWPWAAFIAWGAPREATVFSRLASLLAWITSAAALAWMIAAAVVLQDPKYLSYGVTPTVDWMLWATPVIAGLVAVVLLCSLVAWLRGYWRFSGRLHYTCVLLAGLAFVWFLHYGNLLRLPV